MRFLELLNFLETLGRRPNRRLSQNFLIDGNISRKILETANIGSGDLVLEIGPGAGALTSQLLAAGTKVYAVEKDPIFSSQLSRLQTPDDRLISIHEDFLDFNLTNLLSRTAPPFKVVANLPYHITSPILEKLLEHRDRFTSLTLMVQSELAQRIGAQANTKDFSSLSLFVQFHYHLTSSFTVAPSCFYPKPKVSSKVIHLTPNKDQTLSAKDEGSFFTIVRRAFQQRRKMIRVSLQSLYPPLLLKHALFTAAGSSDCRPQELTLQQWIALFKKIYEGCP